jgi:hypothetical protein
LGSGSLESPVSVSERRCDRVRSERILLHYHAGVEFPVEIKIAELELERRLRAKDRSAESQISIPREDGHSAREC